MTGVQTCALPICTHTHAHILSFLPSNTHTDTAQCVVPHPVPVKTESQTVQLLPHGCDITERRGDKGITEEMRQGDKVITERRGDKGITEERRQGYY